MALKRFAENRIVRFFRHGTFSSGVKSGQIPFDHKEKTFAGRRTVGHTANEPSNERVRSVTSVLLDELIGMREEIG